ncbi:MAG: two-component system, OmpR family, sensor kinase [Gaiellales bacterium]|jgi:signal transduction histidine kinase|nr:two-component system, OmpR family, sensor kinase [Gaiellales bacterium]
MPSLRLSLRARLTLAFAAGMMVVSVGVGVFIYTQVRRDLRDEVDLGLRGRAQALVASAALEHGLAPTSGHLADNDESFAQLLSADGAVVDSTRSVRGRALVGDGVLGQGRPVFVDRTPPGLEPARLLVVPVTAHGRRAYLVVGATMSDTGEALTRLLALLAIAFPAALVVSSLIGWLLAGAALRPVRRMSAEAAAVTAAHPDRRLQVPRTDPGLALLAATLNSTFDRLQEAVRRERAFVQNASHELRTPLTILKAEVDTALSAPRSADELRDALDSAAGEVRHLIRIAEGLLVVARANDGCLPVEREPVSMGELVNGGISAFAAHAEAAGVDLVGRGEDAIARIDPTRARQALDNLLANAIRHSPPGGRVTVVARVADERAVIEVSDQGPGFDEQMLARVFQPFNRGADNPDGAGLGLSLVRAIAEAHDGGASAENPPAGGARVTAWFGAANTVAADRSLVGSELAQTTIR